MSHRLMNLRTLTSSYILALSIIALLGIGSHGLLDRVISAQQDDAFIINVSGRQRMLSQRISAFALRLSEAVDSQQRAAVRDQLQKAISLMADSHNLLLRGGHEHGSPTPLSATLHTIYYGEPHFLHEQVQSYLRHARALVELNTPFASNHPNVQAIIAAAADRLLNSLDTAVAQYEYESRERVDLLQQTQFVLLGVLLLALLMEAMLIFRPMARRILQQTQALTDSRNAYVGIFETVGDALLVLDQSLQIRRYNQAATNLFRADDTRPLLGQAFADLIADPKLLPQLIARRQFGHREETHAHSLSGTDADFTFEFTINEYRSEGETLYILSGRDIEERKQMQNVLREREHLAYLAHHDPLTGLANRTAFMTHVQDSLQRAHRYQEKIGLLFIDLDHFKPINDRLGHETGDKVLCKIAERLQHNLRDCDLSARLGGDEFGILLDKLQQTEDAAYVAEKLLSILTQPFDFIAEPITVSASIGISIFPDDGGDMDTLLHYADIAMYSAKQQGRNDYRFFTPSMNAQTNELHKLIEGLEQACKHNEFYLEYQPRFDLSSREIIGLEALIRWHHPELGLLMPARFIKIAEKRGLIDTLLSWVLTTACRQLKVWQNQGLQPPPIAINLTAEQFRKAEFVALIHSVLEQTGCHAKSLELEFTEQALQAYPEATYKAAAELQAHGLRLSLDDFGSGYTSFSQLARLPIAHLKIDRRFITQLPHDRDTVAMVRAIIALAQGLRIQAIAEGIETPEQLEFLKNQGCKQGQGYLLAKPMPTESIEQYLRQALTQTSPDSSL